ncbi:TIGR03915 family putative DNA repair protein [Acetobacter malorum]|uniref:TIGR03915 family putative DNA repair protein n=1 Tax=Acetobacter malorum TaxID=178901 RepID=UPI0039EC5B15
MAYGFILDDHTSFSAWRPLARQCFLADRAPEEIEWRCASAETTLFDTPLLAPTPKNGAQPPVLRSKCLALLRSILRHADQTRFALAYRILWRAQTEPALASIATDPDIARALNMHKQVREDTHKMTAYVRFREHGVAQNGRRSFYAWFEPDHYVLPSVAPFFSKRFVDMDWVILTPKGSLAWNGETCAFSPTPCAKPKLSDDIDQLWQTYYVSTFNPARIKTKAMLSEMPRKYWKNLPETQLIPQMLADAPARVAAMAAQQPRPAPAFHHRLQQRHASAEEAPALVQKTQLGSGT